MSRYKPFGKSKSQHGGGQFQFDKLLKVCSNSKKVATATNTIGSIGRFGIASFTSVRNSNLDSSGEDNKLKSKTKRPRLDSSKSGIPPLDSFGYPHIHTQNIPGSLSQENNTQMSAATVFKPRKFFKSRGPIEVTHGESNNAQIPPPLRPFVPPITIPIPTLTLSLHNPSRKANASKKSHKKDTNKPKHSHSHAHSNDSPSTLQTFTSVSQTTLVTPPANNNIYNPTNIVSPSIKLRIFKDKTTSTFVSVSDASPQNLVEPLELKVNHHRGKKKKIDIEKLTRKAKTRQEVPPKPVVPSGRITRNSNRHQNSNLSSDITSPMPVLSRADASLGLTALIEAESHSIESTSASEPNESDSFEMKCEKLESSVELVKKLEEEDPEFRQLSAMLSSMEEGEGEDEQSKLQTPSPSPPAQNVPTSFNADNQLRRPSEDSRNNLRDILEDDWDETYDDDSPKKPNQSPSKVTRFDMSAAFGEDLTVTPERSKSLSKSPTITQFEQKLLHFIPDILGNADQPFNAPHAVRNLLSGFTDPSPIVKKAAVETGVEIDIPKRHAIDFSSSLPGVVCPTKKGSIFKSRAVIPSTTGESANNSKKRLALYKHKFGQESGEIIQEKAVKMPEVSPSSYSDFGDEDDGAETEAEDLSLRRLRVDDSNGCGSRSGSPNDGTKVVCRKKSKRLFTVVRNVKAIHELQESGEVHEFDGDVWYILEDLKDKNPMTSRCLSAITLAMRCMEPAFRMHLRAHGTVAEFCKELHDAPTNPVLALLAATVLFVLSQDRLNMDLDTESLQLIIALSKIEEKTHLFDENSEIAKHRQRVIDLVSEMKCRGHAEHLKIEKITAAELALETLLCLTSKRAGEWVKHELRTLGGLDYITTEVDKSLNCLKSDLIASMGWTESVHERLWKIDRCLRVLQQVSFNHEENQRYLLGAVHQSSGSQSQTELATPICSPGVFVSLFRFFGDHLSELSKDSTTASILRELLFSVLRVLVNLTHDFRGIVLGSEILASEPGFIPLILHSVFHLSSIFLDDKVFDLLMHSLCMLLNLVEHSRRNRNVILAMSVRTSVFSTDEISTLDALIQMFFERERAATTEEGHTDDILTKSSDAKESKDSQGASDSQKSSQEKDSEGSSVQDIIDKLIQTAGRHMENSLIAAYISLLLAYLIMDDPVSIEHVRNAMPNSKFLPLMVFLKKLFNFMSITSSASGSIRGLKATSTALKFYAKHDPVSNEELKKVIPD